MPIRAGAMVRCGAPTFWRGRRALRRQTNNPTVTALVGLARDRLASSGQHKKRGMNVEAPVSTRARPDQVLRVDLIIHMRTRSMRATTSIIGWTACANMSMDLQTWRGCRSWSGSGEWEVDFYGLPSEIRRLPSHRSCASSVGPNAAHRVPHG